MRGRKENRVVIDTNLWISFLISKRTQQLESILVSEPVTIIYSDKLLEEIHAVLQRPKFRKYFSDEAHEIINDIMNTIGEHTVVQSEINICRDKKDNFLLALCHDSSADYLVTGDEDLLELKKIGSTKIITIKDFIALY